MSELIYIVTMIYSVYVIDDVVGDKIAAYFNHTFHLDLSKFQAHFRKTAQGLSRLNIFKLTPST